MPSKTLVILTAFALFSSFAEAQVKLGRNVQQEIRVSSEATEVSATLSVTQAHTALSGGKVVDGSIIGLFVPSSRLFWWAHMWSTGESDPETVLKDFLNSFTFSVHSDQIACFNANGRSLWVLTSEMRVSSLDEGLSQARKLLPEQLSKYVSGETMWFQRVPIAQAVGQTFLTPKVFGDPPLRLNVGAIERSPSGWRIEIKNDRGERKTVILSKDFETATSASQ